MIVLLKELHGAQVDAAQFFSCVTCIVEVGVLFTVNYQAGKVDYKL